MTMGEMPPKVSIDAAAEVDTAAKADADGQHVFIDVVWRCGFRASRRYVVADFPIYVSAMTLSALAAVGSPTGRRRASVLIYAAPR